MTSSPAEQESLSWRREVDGIFAPSDRRDSPGCAAAVYKDDKIVYERGYGAADLEHAVPITPATVFLRRLRVEAVHGVRRRAPRSSREGLASTIRSAGICPSCRAHADGITVRHLVHHTSGLRDFYTLLSIAGRRARTVLFETRAILRLAARQRALNFAPGDDYLYSNTGYTLLAVIVGRATGMGRSAATREQQIFEPLGMSSSQGQGDDAARLVPGRAYGYTSGPRGEARLDTPAGERVGAGGLLTTVRDLAEVGSRTSTPAGLAASR